MTTTQHIIRSSLRDEEPIGIGSNASVFYLKPNGIDDLRGHVIRAVRDPDYEHERGVRVSILSSSRLYPVNMALHHYNFGQALYRSKNGDISIHPELRGQTLQALYASNVRKADIPLEITKRLAALPQESWDDFVQQVKFALGVGANIDLHPANVMLNKKGKLTLFEVDMPTDGQPIETQQHLSCSIETLLGGVLPYVSTNAGNHSYTVRVDELPKIKPIADEIRHKLELAMQHCAFDKPLDLEALAKPSPEILNLPNIEPSEHAYRLAASLMTARSRFQR